MNNKKYDEITIDIVACQHPDNPNYYYLKNKVDDNNLFTIGRIYYRDDDFYISIKGYIELNYEALIAICKYIDTLEKIEGDFPEITKTSESIENNGELTKFVNLLNDFEKIENQEEKEEKVDEENN